MVTITEKFAERFNKALDEANVPVKGRQYRVSEMFKVSSAMAWKWIKGRSIPEITRIPEMEKKLKKPEGYLLGYVDKSNVIKFPEAQNTDLDDQLLAMYLEKIEEIFPKYGLKSLTAYQKTALAKIGYDSRAGKEAPSEDVIEAEVIQWAQAFRASGGS